MKVLRLVDNLRGRGERQWIQTFSGGRYYPAAPRVDEVRIVDIAHHLSMLCRFTGAVRRFYSVAEHSVLVSHIGPPEFALERLLHDAPEFVLNDQNRPTKRLWSMWGYRRLERINWRVIAQKFGLNPTMHWTTKSADDAVLMAERRALMPRGADWRPWGLPPAADVAVVGLPPEEAERVFLQRFYELTAARGQEARLRAVLRQSSVVSAEGCATR